jgi:hypothetical protein
MPKRTPILLIAAALAVGATITAPSGATSNCVPAGAHVLASSASAAVYSSGSVVYGCSDLTRLQTKLGHVSSCIQAHRIYPVRVVGDLSAYGDEVCGVDTGTTSVVVLRLSDGKQLSSDPATTGLVFPESYESIGSLVLRSDGAVAWISVTQSVVGGAAKIEVQKDDHGQRLLDSGAAIKPGSLVLHGSMLSWKHGRATRNATL